MTHHDTAVDSLQAAFLKQLKEHNATVSVFLVNGIKLHGVITDFDCHVVMLTGTVTQMIYKHAISTVVPTQKV